MQGFDPNNHAEPVAISFPTDTATPQPVIPIFLFHTHEQPFCKNPGCGCANTKKLLAILQTAIEEGELTIVEAKTLLVQQDGV